jgi:hypothetical protein
MTTNRGWIVLGRAGAERGDVMELTLSLPERELLLEVLEEHHRELLMEIARASHYDFKTILRNKEKLLESMINKLVIRQPGEAVPRSA